MIKKILFILLFLAFTMATSLKADTLPLLIFDDFTAGDTINSSLWDINDPEGIFSQSDGFLQANGPPKSSTNYLRSNKSFSGDFEFTLDVSDFSSTAYLADPGDIGAPAINFYAVSKNAPNLNFGFRYCQIYSGGTDGLIISQGIKNGIPTSWNDDYQNISTGPCKLKIQRNGTTITTHFDKGSGWKILAFYPNSTTDDFDMLISIETGVTGIFHAKMDAIYYSDTPPVKLNLPWYYDADGDGYGDPSTKIDIIPQVSGYVTNNTDCDDSDATVNPGVLDTCGDGIDQNCDGTDKICYIFPTAMTTKTVYTDKKVNFKSEYKVLATINYSELYSGYNSINMHGAINYQTFGDLNNDGKEDIVFAFSFLGKKTMNDGLMNDELNVASSTVFLISENNTLSKNSSVIEDAVYHVHPNRGIIADFNGDGKNDYFSSCTGPDVSPFLGDQNILLLSTKKGTLKDVSNTHLPLLNDMSHGAGKADIDGDGDIDIFLVNNGGIEQIDCYFLINDGAGNFKKDDSPSRVSESLIKFHGINSGTNAFYSTANFFDVNGDTFPDLLLPTLERSNPENYTEFYHSRIVYNDGKGGFFSNKVYEFPPGGFNEKTLTSNIDPIDINNDGHIDFILSQSKDSNGGGWRGQYHQVLINDSSENFKDDTVNRIPYQNFDYVAEEENFWPTQTFFTDMNSDGHLDIVINSMASLVDGNEKTSTKIYINNEFGIFLPLPNNKVYSGSDTGKVGISLSPIDFDKDGDIDLIGVNPKGYSGGGVYHNTGVDVVLFENETYNTANPATWYYDSDNDGYGDPNISMVATVKPSNYVINNKDCNDYDASVHPGTVDITGDGIDQNCNGSDGKATVNSITIESDLSFELLDTIYKSLTGDVNLWTDFKFFGEQSGKLIWELEDYGATISVGNPITIESDFSFSIPNATYQPTVGNKINLEMDFKFFGDQSGKLLWELDNYTIK